MIQHFVAITLLDLLRTYKKVNQVCSFDEVRERAILILVIGNALLSLFVITHFLWFCNLTIKLTISALPHISRVDSIAELKHTPLLIKAQRQALILSQANQWQHLHVHIK